MNQALLCLSRRSHICWVKSVAGARHFSSAGRSLRTTVTSGLARGSYSSIRPMALPLYCMGALGACLLRRTLQDDPSSRKTLTATLYPTSNGSAPKVPSVDASFSRQYPLLLLNGPPDGDHRASFLDSTPTHLMAHRSHAVACARLPSSSLCARSSCAPEFVHEITPVACLTL